VPCVQGVAKDAQGEKKNDMRTITKIEATMASRCAFAGCEISSDDMTYFITIGAKNKKLPFCHDCATRLGELFGIQITNVENLSEFAGLGD
jgi:hypothetical protein